MQTHTGVAAQMFRVLANEGTNIKIVTTSEIKISVLIDRADCDKVANAVHTGFRLNESVATTPRIGVASTNSSGVRKVRMLSTGPKISSRAMRWLMLTFAKIVGRKK